MTEIQCNTHDFGPWQLVTAQKQQVTPLLKRVDNTPTFGAITDYENIVVTNTELLSVSVCSRCGERLTR